MLSSGVPTINSRRHKTLSAVCDTFVPGWSERTSSEADPGLLERSIGLIERVEDPMARWQIGMLLDALDSGAVNVLLGSPFHAITELGHDQRIALLREWADSAIAMKRAGFQALKRLVLVAHYAFPSRGASHPAWSEVGYPGALPHEPGEVNQPLPIERIEKDATLDCDVVVVGSGAGGGVAAGILAQSLKSVIVLEKGGQHTPKDFSHVEGEGFDELYADHGLMMTKSGSMPILAGSGLGGGTVINYTTSFALPEATREEWNRLSGLSLFTSGRFADALTSVEARLKVSTIFSAPSRRDQILEEGCTARGYHVGVIPRNAAGCPSAEACGYCGMGCRHNAKQSTALTYLRDAVNQGARIVTRADVLHILIDQRRAWGVVARVRKPDGTQVMLTVRAKAVVVACGSIGTPALLTRSGVNNRNIGRGLRLHPVTAVGGFFPERVAPWVGHLQTRYSDQFANLRDGYGAKFETAPVAFALPASAFGWDDPVRHRADIARLAHLGIVGILLRDRASGEVQTGKAGIPRVAYDLSGFDTRNLRVALRGAADVLAAAGASELMTLQQPPVRITPGSPGWLNAFAAAMDARGYAAGRMSFITFHQMGTCAMGRNPRTSVVGETGESHDVKGLYVADASAFPTSSGVNPMITIMAIAHVVAQGLQA